MRVLTIIPTYNEIESLPITLGRLREANPEVDVLVVDDGSPDGTGAWADERSAADSKVICVCMVQNQLMYLVPV